MMFEHRNVGKRNLKTDVFDPSTVLRYRNLNTRISNYMESKTLIVLVPWQNEARFSCLISAIIIFDGFGVEICTLCLC